ncbi:MAG: hypothetical protein KF878_25770 [Planctomycetes bacterium]|nr:hypothetical protein [Planctomycetota bacterium]
MTTTAAPLRPSWPAILAAAAGLALGGVAVRLAVRALDPSRAVRASLHAGDLDDMVDGDVVEVDDPWGRPYVSRPGDLGLPERIWSRGPDGADDGGLHDDVLVFDRARGFDLLATEDDKLFDPLVVLHRVAPPLGLVLALLAVLAGAAQRALEAPRASIAVEVRRALVIAALPAAALIVRIAGGRATWLEGQAPEWLVVPPRAALALTAAGACLLLALAVRLRRT